MKKILVIGGSYFTGRIFSLYTVREKLAELTVVNRGSYPLEKPEIREIVCDRHEPEKLAELLPRGESYDAVVDFCGYAPGDVRTAIGALKGRFGHYIFLSTASVYEPASGPIDENGALVGELPAGEAGEYIERKLALERELADACGDTPYTILRPAFIYGPYNYAPRESYFIKKLAAGEPIPYPVGSSSRFSFVYVTDAARAVHAIIGDSRAFGRVFNLAGPEQIGYRTYFDTLRACHGKSFPVREMTVREAAGLPLPFPLEGDLLYSGEKLTEDFDFTYTPFAAGMELTYRAFMPVFVKKS